MKRLKQMPLPITAVSLGLVSLANLLKTYSASLANILALISAIIFVAVLVRIIADFKGFKKFLSQPLNSGVFASYPMAGMLLSVYLKALAPGLATALWYISIVVQVIVMVYTFTRFLSKGKIENFFASTYVPFVGIVVGSISSPAFGAEGLGKFFVYFGIVSWIILSYFILRRVFVLKTIPDKVWASNGIVAAPASLILAGYNSVFQDRSTAFIWIFLIISQILYFIVLSKAGGIFKKDFHPSFGGYTFPIVISAIALKTSTAFLTKQGGGSPVLTVLVKLEEIVALVLVLYILYLFLKATFSAPVEEKPARVN